MSDPIMYHANREELEDVLAIQVYTPDDADSAAAWCGGLAIEEIDPETNVTYPGCNVPTPDGMKRASTSDAVVLYSDEHFDVVRGFVFRSHYKPIV